MEDRIPKNGNVSSGRSNELKGELKAILVGKLATKPRIINSHTRLWFE
jgi:hypothetical protein